ncbi:MAG: hypothetical protein J0H78_08135 [Rhizobiales bacterium]|nr:hypothetical protein [Hyphomicrobiales bacterium]
MNIGYGPDLNQLFRNTNRLRPLKRNDIASAKKINACLKAAIREIQAAGVHAGNREQAVAQRLQVVENSLADLINITMVAPFERAPWNPLHQVLSNVLLLIELEDEWGTLHVVDVKKMPLMAWRYPEGAMGKDIRYTPLLNLRRLLELALEPERARATSHKNKVASAVSVAGPIRS